jgi:hypothetical protein
MNLAIGSKLRRADHAAQDDHQLLVEIVDDRFRQHPVEGEAPDRQ